ncbi:hypothetical protein GmHk_02G004432 [Glycine max]|nr:hypothetical protein GmHk_02G004432 [Glycine max]
MEMEGEKKHKFDVDLSNLMAFNSYDTFLSQPFLSRAPIFAEEALEGRRETVRLYSVDQVLVVCKEDDKLPSSPRKALFEGVGNQ